MKRFTLVWAGQLLSTTGSGLTAFALAVWVYLRTGSVVDLAVIAAAAWTPQVLVAPFGGALADRFSRRRMMVLADLGAVSGTLALLACAQLGVLEPWSAALLVAFGSSCNALQWPAWEAAIVTLVPADQLGRASGMVELSRGVSQLAAPLAGGALFSWIGLQGVIAVDIATFVLGVVPLLLLRFPSLARARESRRQSFGALLTDLREAWCFMAQRAGLLAMLALFAVTNFTFAVVELLLKPLVLSFASPTDLGLVLSSVGVGMVVGAVAMTVWGCPRRKIITIFLFQLLEGAALVAGGARPMILLLCLAGFVYGLTIPITFGCARTIWQSKVPKEMQGRVAALRNALLAAVIPIGYLVASPLVDHGVAPLLAEGGWFADCSQLLVGDGPGRASALVIMAMGVLNVVAASWVFAMRRYRRIERELPDLLG